MQDSIERLTSSLRSSQMLRLLLVGFLALLLQIPIALIAELVSERQERRQEAVAEVSSKWGNAQVITGPALVVPYTWRWTEFPTGGQEITRTEVRNAIFLPERLHTRGSIDSETRYRGIFSVPVYRLGLTVEGEFARPSFSELSVEPAAVDWERAYLAVGISDARAIQKETAVSWHGQRVPFLPGTGAFLDGVAGIRAAVGVADATERFKFSFPLSLNGSLGLYLTPFGQQTIVELQSDYGHPSFQGNWLPNERTVSATDFQAKWSIPFLGRNYPQAWRAEATMNDAIDGSRFGVELVHPVDHYRMAERSAKYAFLFILLPFAIVWLIEVLAGVRVHPIQFLMLGGALCLFYLLEALTVGAHRFPARLCFGERFDHRTGGSVLRYDTAPYAACFSCRRRRRPALRLPLHPPHERGLCPSHRIAGPSRHPRGGHVRHAACGLVHGWFPTSGINRVFVVAEMTRSVRRWDETSGVAETPTQSGSTLRGSAIMNQIHRALHRGGLQGRLVRARNGDDK